VGAALGPPRRPKAGGSSAARPAGYARAGGPRGRPHECGVGRANAGRSRAEIQGGGVGRGGGGGGLGRGGGAGRRGGGAVGAGAAAAANAVWAAPTRDDRAQKSRSA